ncbi:C40 family peptidase [Lipingzhangella sp. LS1_29]|uniref:C40 family peptidase n=1 Tax=Lipingzhangella rawalii TaxID=2055835 RepID=A0ABU2H482_9ACTN|nr:C40 family peptidase [Lipingzhangella rawalii]MDS1270096.1 C40 family peptidase [Lipingzhangella rawalii]
MSAHPSLSSRFSFPICRGIRAVTSLLTVVTVVAGLGLANAGATAASTAPPTQPTVAASDVASGAVSHARSRVGAPYRFGASGPNSFDCSGLVQWSYAQAGHSLPRTTSSQVSRGSAVSRSQLRQGDLLFFYSSRSHVGIYVGGDRMVHAPSSGGQVRVDHLSGYWNSVFSTARRVA